MQAPGQLCDLILCHRPNHERRILGHLQGGSLDGDSDGSAKYEARGAKGRSVSKEFPPGLQKGTVGRRETETRSHSATPTHTLPHSNILLSLKRNESQVISASEIENDVERSGAGLSQGSRNNLRCFPDTVHF